VSWLGQPKANKVKIFCLFKSLWNVQKPNFTLIPCAAPKLLGQKSQNLLLGQNVLQHSFSLYRYFIEATTTDIDMLLQVSFLTKYRIFCDFRRNIVVLPTTGRLKVAYVKCGSTWCWSKTMQNHLSDFSRFIDTGYFSYAFGLIFVCGLPPLVSLGLSHFWFSFQFNGKTLTYRFDF